MKKAAMIVLFTLFSIVLVGCTNLDTKQEVEIKAITIKDGDLQDSYIVGTFSPTELQITINYEDGKFEYIPVTEDMISSADLEKLSSVGTHTIEILYKGLKTKVDIVIAEDYYSYQDNVRVVYNMALDSGVIVDQTYEEWLLSIQGPENDSLKEVNLRIKDASIQWQYIDGTSWSNLIEVTKLTESTEKSAFDLFKEEYTDYTGDARKWVEDLVNGNILDYLSYTVTFLNDDESVIETVSVKYGEILNVVSSVNLPDGTLLEWFYGTEKLIDETDIKVLYDMTFVAEITVYDAVPGVTNTSITVGNTVATSGPLAFVGLPYSEGMKAYFNMVNSTGGINGRSIELIQYDDQFDTVKGYTYTKTLVEDDQVFAIVGHFGTPTVSSTIDYLQETGIPQVYFATGMGELFNELATGDERSSFPVQPIYQGEGQVMVARAVHDLNAKKIGIIYELSDSGKGIYSGASLQAELEGVTLVGYETTYASNELSTVAAYMINQNVDVIIIANQAMSAMTVQALFDEGSTIPLITSYVNATALSFSEVQSTLTSFDIYSSQWYTFFDESGISFTDDYNLYISEISKVDPMYATNIYSVAGWIAAATFVEGLNQVGNDQLSWNSYIDAMENEPLELPFGVIVDFTNGRRAGTQTMSFLKATVTDGVFTWETVEPLETIDEIVAK